VPDDQVPAGWFVLDPDGNVVDSGPCIALEMTTDVSGGNEEDGDARDG
jgi:hypothetical protein